MVHKETERLQSGRICPVQIFYYLQYGLLLRLRHKESQQSLLELLSPPLGSQGEGRIMVRQGKRKQRGEQRHCLQQRKAKPLQEIDHRIQRAVLVIRRAEAL